MAKTKRAKWPLPPWIDSQRMLLLRNVSDPQKHLTPQAFRASRLRRDKRRVQDSATPSRRRRRRPWVKTNKRRVFLDWLLQPKVPSRRLCVTTDGGIGKTTLLQWATAAIARHRPEFLAVYLPLGKIAVPAPEEKPLDWIKRIVVAAVAEGVHGAESNGRQVSIRHDELANQVERLLHQQRLVLLFDALDQTRSTRNDEVSPKIAALAAVLKADGHACRVVVSGRPHGVERYWSDLFADSSTSPARAWRYVQLLPFTEEQVKIYLGDERVELLQQLDVDVLRVPRFLEVLYKLDDLGGIATSCGVYFECLEEDLRQIENKDALNRLGQRVKLKKSEVEKLLALLAFEMLRADNFEGVAPADFEDFRGAVWKRRREDLAEFTSLREFGDQLDLVAQANEALEHGYLDHDGLTQVYWRDPTLQAFFAAIWIVKYASADDLTWWGEHLFLSPPMESDAFLYSVWRFVCEMPLERVAANRWTAAVKPLFRPGDGTPPGPRRSTEMIYRAHANWESRATGKLKDLFKSECLDEYQQEFQRIIAGDRGAEARRIAADFSNGFKSIIPNDKGIPQTFQMGSPLDEPRRGDDEHQHEVKLTKPFSLAEYAVTNEQYGLFDPEHHSRYSDYKRRSPEPRCPAIYVCWYDALSFCLWLGPEYRLPSEAEWEYACRAGTETRFHFGEVLNGTQANCDGNYPYGDESRGPYLERTTPVGDADKKNPDDPRRGYRRNALELSDMHGNVWEWCSDWYGAYPKAPVTDPEGPPSGRSRVLRGGSWFNFARSCRSANRFGNLPVLRDDGMGFRVARTS
ncbi:MAG: SUMF1/EgtB/PvdO family nonheme iron enzyme [Pirellulales bacterium]|nr:SUMF1/EgtB/PvdO family nonheme iron enzyme [Pirellulales bacterium]